MTKLALLRAEEASAILADAWLYDQAEVSGIAELIRGEVSARKACQRSSTIRRVCRLAAPVTTIDETLVAQVCDLLVREGDVVVGTGGVLFSTPLRAVDLGGGEFRIASTLPTKHLASFLRGSWNIVGASRTYLAENEQRARNAVAAAGGIMLSPADWACLDRTSPADQSWLESLDRRLRADSEAPGSLEREEPLVWRGCVATAGRFGWASAEAAKAARLWRARNRWGHWLFAWSQDGSPKNSPFVALRPDDGTRSAFAVARSLGSPVEASIERRNGVAVLAVPHWLPVAEYRFLAVASSSSVTDGGRSRWTLPAERLEQVLGILSERLGLVVREVAGR
jgi:hypothetical protein